MRAVPAKHEGHAFPLRHDELRRGPEIVAGEGHRRAQLDRIRAGDDADSIFTTTHPRHDATIAEAEDELGLHSDRPATPLDDPDYANFVFVFGSWHEVDDGTASARRREFGLKDEGTLTIASPNGIYLALW